MGKKLHATITACDEVHREGMCASVPPFYLGAALYPAWLAQSPGNLRVVTALTKYYST